MLAKCSIVFHFSCLFLWGSVTDVFLLRGFGNLLFCVLQCGWDRNEILYRWMLVFTKSLFQVLVLFFFRAKLAKPLRTLAVQIYQIPSKMFK